MPARRRQAADRFARQSLELAIATPQVVAHRLTRMAAAGHRPSARDVVEFQRMGTEKLGAFAESWQAMAAQAMVAQQSLALAWWRSLFRPWVGGPAAFAEAAGAAQAAGMGVLARGMAPVHRRAVANAKRLARRG